MHQALYRKWRPATFDDVCGQEHITPILKYEVANSKVTHAYLFCGSRGTGKTSCAKILAKAINCIDSSDGNPCCRCESCIAIETGTAIDVIEMDAASNNGVDNIRDIKDEVVFTPAQTKYRVYIVDEVHALSPNAFNALLKTLEEPPQHVVFILATTEMHKLPSTIISRCQRFDFKRIQSAVIAARLMHIAQAEGIGIDEDSAFIIARLAQGGMRDAISFLELCSSRGDRVTPALVSELLGVSGREETFELVCAIADKNYEKIFGVIEEVASSSRDIAVFWQELIAYYRDMLVQKTVSDPKSYLELSDTEEMRLKAAAEKISTENIIYHSRILDDAFYSIQRSALTKRNVAEMALIRMCDSRLDDTNLALLSRIADLEDKLSLMGTGAYKPKNSSDNEPNSKKDTPPNGKTHEKDSLLSDESKPASSEGEKAVLRSLPYWAELLEKVGRTSKSAASFLIGSKGYKSSDGAIILQISKPFAANILNRPNEKEAIRMALSALEGMEIHEDSIKIVNVPQKPAKEDSVYDELDKSCRD